jgi:hypothetical protein
MVCIMNPQKINRASRRIPQNKETSSRGAGRRLIACQIEWITSRVPET